MSLPLSDIRDAICNLFLPFFDGHIFSAKVVPITLTALFYFSITRWLKFMPQETSNHPTLQRVWLLSVGVGFRKRYHLAYKVSQLHGPFSEESWERESV
jgi:hypothetical protein